MNVVRILSEKVCPTLPDTARTTAILDRVLTAANKLKTDTMYEDLSAKELRAVDSCIEKVTARKRELVGE